MRRFRFSIKGLAGFVGFVAVAFGALIAGTDLWDSALFTLACGLLAGSVLLAVLRHAEKRAFWVGFAVCGWLYLAASLIPPVESRLLTRRGLIYLDSKLMRNTTFTGLKGLGIAYADFDSDGSLDLLVANSGQPYVQIYNNQGNGQFVDVIRSSGLASQGLLPVAVSGNTFRPVRLYFGGTTENFLRIGHSLIAIALAFLAGKVCRRVFLSRTDPAGESTRVSGAPETVPDLAKAT